MELKQYQEDTLAILRRFLEDARGVGPKDAYEAIVRKPEQAARLGRYAGAYVPLEALPDAPYVCLRLPTGGGKTILAAHAVAVARDAWIEKDWPMVLWLVPTSTIRRQTVEALKSPRHPYRRALDAAFRGRVRVFDVADFTHLRPRVVRDHCCIVVGTIQTLRVSDTEGRKVYAHNEEMEPHFSRVPAAAPGLERLEGGGVKFSFANLLHLHRPLMIVDEAHNAVTGLTREMQARVNPCAVIEFTATPKRNSNILHSVTAQELKREEMIKLPIMLAEHESWQNAVNGAVAMRARLAGTAAGDRGHIRPVALFQAQRKNREVTVEVLKQHLIEVGGAAEETIAVATGDQRELDGIDLFDRSCPVEHVITVEALKEGWDCSFAYVFCSVSRIRSARNAEQLLGRVLRLPYAKRRGAAELNRAYAFLSEPDFGEAACGLIDKLVKMGFEEDEAKDNVEPVQEGLDIEGGLFGRRGAPSGPAFTHEVRAASETLSVLGQRGQDGVTVREAGGGRVEITVAGWVDDELEEAICDALPETERRGVVEAVEEYRARERDRFPPAERGETLTVPGLASEVQGELYLADTDLFMESRDWSLSDHPVRLTDDEFAVRETAHGFEIDLEGRRIIHRFIGEEDQLVLDVDVAGWTPETLVLWLDGQVRQPDVGQSDLVRWLGGLVGHLVTARGLTIASLMRCKFILARAVRRKIDEIREHERRHAWQGGLFEPEARPMVSFDCAFTFRDGMYPEERCYRGGWRPSRHFLGPGRVPAFDGKEDGEEMRCAQALDRLPGLKYWIRNVARHPASFWLPTAAGRFYPDFVARLDDGRRLVVEYKGGLTAEGSDTDEKRAVGALWERKSGGRGLFIVVEKQVDGRDVRTQLLRKIGIVPGTSSGP